jgi:hypothetical protein
LNNKEIELRIPNPCTQPWEQMAEHGEGRFCSHCQKTVIDFTSMSDAAVFKLLRGSKEPVCGRFLASQLGRTITIPPQPHSRLYRIVVALGLTILAAEPVSAQVESPTAKQRTEETMVKCRAPIVWRPKGTLTCTVVGRDYTPVAHATVWISRENQIVAAMETDSAGKIDTLLQVGLYTIQAAHTGYYTSEQQVISIKNEQTTIANIALTYPDDLLGGTFMTGDVMIEEKPHPAKKKTRVAPERNDSKKH